MKRSNMKAVSDRRRRRDAVYPERRRQVWERAGGVCEFCLNAEMVSVHHVEGRVAPRGVDPHRLEALIGLCEPCHRRAHAQPEWARSVGLMRSRLETGPE
jgi:5-methylcytosine-specific restriction endonuclease McrA